MGLCAQKICKQHVDIDIYMHISSSREIKRDKTKCCRLLQGGRGSPTVAVQKDDNSEC